MAREVCAVLIHSYSRFGVPITVTGVLWCVLWCVVWNQHCSFIYSVYILLVSTHMKDALKDQQC